MLIAFGVYVPSGTGGTVGAGAGSGLGGGGGGGAGVSVAERRSGFPAGTLTSFSNGMNASWSNRSRYEPAWRFCSVTSPESSVLPSRSVGPVALTLTPSIVRPSLAVTIIVRLSRAA